MMMNDNMQRTKSRLNRTNKRYRTIAGLLLQHSGASHSFPQSLEALKKTNRKTQKN